MKPKDKTRPDPALRESRPENSPSTVSGYKFKDPELLRRALTHRSLAYETNRESLANPQADNEQLEFVGDAVLGLVVAEFLFRRFPASREGELTRLRASIVSRRHLGEMAARIDLGSLLRLGKGEERSGGRSKSALLSNSLEAVIAAVYLDGGLKAAARFVESTVIEPALPALDLALGLAHDPSPGLDSDHLALARPAGSSAGSALFSGAVGDHKSALQEHLQSIGAGQPMYVLTAETGPDHRKRFHVEVRLAAPTGAITVLAESEGPTKKAAQQEAAKIAFSRLLHELETSTLSVGSHPELASMVRP